MDAQTLTLLATFFAIASAVAIVAVGVMMLLTRVARPRGALAFGIFGVIWGIQLILSNATRVVRDPALSEALQLAALAALIPLPYFLVEFASAQATGQPRGRWTAVRFGVAGVALVAALLFVAFPSLLFQGVEVLPDRIRPIWGPLHVPLVTLPYVTSFALALLALNAAKTRSPTHRVGERAAILLAGLALYVAFAASNNLTFFLGAAFFADSFDVANFVDPRALAFVVPYTLLTIAALYVGIANLRSARRALVKQDARRDRLVALACLVPLAWGAVEGYLALETLPLLETVGLWRLAGVAIIAYGLARWRSYDLPQRARRAGATAAGTTVALAGGAAAFGAGAAVTTSTLAPSVAAIVVASAALLPAVTFARRLFGIDNKLPRRDLEQALYGQRIDAYRAALEASLSRDSLDEDAAFLAALRERFHISPDEDRVLSHLAKSSVIVARERHAWDAYERLRLLGEGGGGRTWLARDRARDRLVVLKEPLERWQQEPAAREAVLREARLAAKVRHPNVVAVEEVVEGKGSPIIVMEYLEGGSVADLLRAKGALQWPEARDLMVDVLHGLEAVHAAGIVHRDVKPSNILLTGDGHAKIADFGIAVSPASSGARTMLMDPLASTVAGTANYMSPEARNGAPPDRRADVYACAAVLHEMIYGAPPSVRSPTVVRDDLPARLPPLLARALAPRPEERVPTARAFADELARIV